MHVDSSHPTVLPSSRPGDAPVPASPKPPAINEYHGTIVIDPYHWLEDLEHPDVRAWVAQQNQRTQAYFTRNSRIGTYSPGADAALELSQI